VSSPPPEARRPAAGYLARDLFFGVRIVESLLKLGITAQPVHPDSDAAALGRYALLLVDMSLPEDRWLPLIERAREADVPVLAFGSHMDVGRWQRARAAGATRTVANSQLVEHFPALVRRLLGGAGDEPAGPDDKDPAAAD
jgi:CheY-like chemotaxis protein